MNAPILQAAAKLQAFLEGAGWDFAFIGGLAVNRWGRPRTTNDADVCLLTGFGQEQAFAEALLNQFEGRIEDALQFSLQTRVLLLRGEDGFGFDISFGALPFEANAISRSSDFDFPGGVRLRTVSAEDLITMKAFASRGQDWVDVESVLIRQGESIDMDLVRQELAVLCEYGESPENIDQLERLWLASQE